MIKAEEATLLRTFPRVLECYYPSDKIHATEDFIYVEGDIPVGLVAHLDTVHARPPEVIFHDQEHKVIWSPEGLGADDRAGIYGILALIMGGYRPSIFLTTGEERGGLGAISLIKKYPTPPTELNFLIELDRQGRDEAVYYDCVNKEFESFINSFGFSTAIGIFSDISFIAPKWNLAAVNLSIGYFNEHYVSEFLCYNYMEETIEKVSHILEEYGDEKFDYGGGKYDSWLKDAEIWPKSM